jgi:uncharacterized membrane protein HdeD (DUF308 family)
MRADTQVRPYIDGIIHIVEFFWKRNHLFDFKIVNGIIKSGIHLFFLFSLATQYNKIHLIIFL